MITFKDYSELQEASYAGNIGIMELIQFYSNATPELVSRVKSLIASKKNKEAWDIIQKETGVKLHSSAYK